MRVLLATLLLGIPGLVLSSPALYCGYDVADPRPWEGETIPGVETLIVTPRLFIGASGAVDPREPGWLLVYDRESREILGSLGIFPHPEGRHVRLPIYLDRVFDREVSADWFRARFIGPRRFGKGIGTEAKYAAVAYAFKILGLSKSYARVVSHNTASLRLHRKLGYVPVAEADVPEDCRVLEPQGPLTYFLLTRDAFEALERRRRGSPMDYVEFFDPSKRLKTSTLHHAEKRDLLTWYERFGRVLAAAVVKDARLAAVPDRLRAGDPVDAILAAYRVEFLEDAVEALRARHGVDLAGRGERAREYHQRLKELVSSFGDAQLLAMLSAESFQRLVDRGDAQAVLDWIEAFERGRDGVSRPLAFPHLRDRLKQMRAELKTFTRRATVVVRAPTEMVWDLTP